MATLLHFLVLGLVCIHANAFSRISPPAVRNTIFGDERLKGEIFENIDAFSGDITLYNDADNPYRLPTTTRPQYYNILWQIDISSLSFTGTVNIDLVATQANVNEIVLHSDRLVITSHSLTLGATVVPTTIVAETEYHFLRFQLTNATLQYNNLIPVVYRLTISFSAPMRDDMYGIYRTWFRNNPTDQNLSWMAATQFQATAARSAFPCYDEPGFKAYFDITIRRPTTHRSWSCMRIRETVAATTGYQDDIYYRTPLMSTYLLAIIVADYVSLSNDGALLTYEVIARNSSIQSGHGQYAFDVGLELLATMSNHTAIDFYSVDSNLKMTQAAIPDFGAGAMENWGLLTYREAYLLYDSVQTNDYYKQIIAYILSHEIAHMWFGNLVTCDWWDVLWLNEGFARYYQYFLTHWVEDYMGFETRFITEQIHTSLLSDSVDNAHPLSNPGVGSPAAVSAMFSTLTYNKGASVIRMTEHLLGFDIHRQGLRNYLAERYFDVALPSHLFQALQDVGNSTGSLAAYGPDFTISDYYRSWTEQGGHPVLNVQVNHATGEMTIYQRRFNINTGYSSINANWIVPITFATASNPDFANTKPTHIINKAVTIINRGSVGDEWVIFNKQQTGFYRVNYDDYTWDLIVLALRGNARTQIHEYNRAQIVNDVFQFARSGLMSYTRAFTILSFLENETEYAPWVAAMTGFTWIRNRLVGSPYLSELEAMISRWANTVMNQITYYPPTNTEESFMRSYLRYQLAPIMCQMGVPACLTAANAQFQALRDNAVEVPANSRNWVYCNGLRQGATTDFNFLWTRFQQHNVYTEKIVLLSTLGCTPHAASLNTFVAAIMEDNYIIRPQDYTTALNSAVSGNEGNTQIVFTYIQNNLATVMNAFDNIATPLSYISARLRTEAEINAYIQWANANQAILGDSYQRIVSEAEATRVSIAWVNTVASDLNNYLVNGNQQVETTTAVNVPVVNPTTETQPVLIEPISPELPDSAVTSALSVFLVVSVIIINLVF